ncbi:MAG: hypothetical protein H6747_01340 [Deltaproteobacteria bacterium]|nr:hypothetical protein [Deltaproteobacteria bacterium]
MPASRPRPSTSSRLARRVAFLATLTVLAGCGNDGSVSGSSDAQPDGTLLDDATVNDATADGTLPLDAAADADTDAGADAATDTDADTATDTDAAADAVADADTAADTDATTDTTTDADTTASTCPSATDGEPCETPSKCALTASCLAGACVVQTLKNCDDGNVCTADSCNPVDGSCLHAPDKALDGAACSDGSKCTLAAGCYSGVCIASKKASCDDGDVCTFDICDPATGACLFKPQPAGTACDDGNACTEGEACGTGGCSGGKNVCPCSSSADCAAKDDGNPCNGSLYCDQQSGSCVINPASVVSCPDISDGVCEKTACNPATGACQVQPAPTNAGCDDGDPCTAGDFCDGKGGCLAGTKVCACATDADCKAQEDGNACTGTLYCDKSNPDAGAACKVNPATVVICPKNNDTHCSKNTCNPATGTCSPVAQSNGLPCEDGELCTKGDACLAGACKSGPDVCACSNDADCALQEDGNLCNGTLVCNQAAGQCELDPKTVVLCPSAGDTYCRANLCDPKTGTCAMTPTNTAQACDDDNVCTTGEVCDLAGECTATNNTCLCQTDADCAAKEDGNLCNGTLFCNQASKQCEVNPTTTISCPTVDDTTCLVNTCLPKKGTCQLLPRNEGLPCDADGNPCTKDDVCIAGSCKAGTNTCECEQDADCASKEDLDLCSKLYCNALSKSCEVNPATAVVCSKVGDTVCAANVCDPKTGVCALTPRNQGLSCDADGSPCTVADACDKGVCKAGGNTCECNVDADCKSKDDGNPCTGTLLCGANKTCQVDPASVVVCQSGSDTSCAKNVCNPATGGCEMKPQNEKSVCGPGSLCFAPSLCDAQGSCAKGAAVDCDDFNACTVDACDDYKGCTHVAGSGASCDDGNVCTENDVCVSGFCTGSQKPCTGGTPCTIDSCHPLQGCQYAPKAGPCDDGNACTEGESCVGKACVGALKVCNDGNPCTTDSCSASVGCLFTPNTATCDDGNLCTKLDRCKDGGCVGLPMVVTVDCDDGNPCTDQSCEPDKGCLFEKSTKPCDDGDPCTGGDACAGGQCLPGKLDPCDDANVCTTDACAAKTGDCSHAAPGGIACDDGNPCTLADACTATACAAGTPNACDDGDPCSADACDPKSGCSHSAASGAACDDGNLCTVNDTCIKGGCAGTAKLCDGGTACTIDSCHPLKGCVYTPRTGSCDDDNACTTGDLCSGSQCVGVPKSCDDGELCTDDGCDPKQGCTAQNNTAPCDDGDLCTKADACKAGGCVGLPMNASVDCDDGNPCTTHTCEKASGCTTAKPAIPCDDGDPCTKGDACKAGVCVAGTDKTCDDGNACTEDVCDPKLGCSFGDLATGAPCDDGKPCTAKANCVKGACLQVTTLSCDDGDPCTADACDADKGCQHSATQASVPCDDGDACTAGSACSEGACVGGSAIDCDDGEACTIESCDKAKGCQHTAALEGSACATGVACQVPGTCQQGVCAGAVRSAFSQGVTGGGGTCEDALAIQDGTTLLVGSRVVDGKQRPLAMRMRFSGKTLAEQTDDTLVGAYVAAIADGEGGFVAVGWRDAGLAGALDGTVGLLDGSGKTLGRVGVGGLQNDRFYDVAKAPAGAAAYVAVGSSVASSENGDDGYFVGLGSDGKPVWQATAGLIVADVAQAVATTGSGIYFVGSSGNQGWLGGLNGAGKLLWEERVAGTVYRDVLLDGAGRLLAAGRAGKAARIEEIAPADGKRTTRFSWIRQFVDRDHTLESIASLPDGGLALSAFEYVSSVQPALVHALVLDQSFAVRWQQQSPHSSATAAVLGQQQTSLMQVHTAGCALWRSDAFGHKSCADAGACHALAIADCSDDDACTAVDWCDKGSCTHSASKTCDDGTVCTTDTCDAKTGSCVFTDVAEQTPCNESSSACAIPGACSKGACVGARVSTWSHTLNATGWLSLPYSAIYWRTDVSRVGVDATAAGGGVAIGAGHNRVSAYHDGGEQQHGTRLAMFRVDAEGKLTHNVGWVEKDGAADYFWHSVAGLARFADEQSIVLVKVAPQTGSSPPPQVRLVRTSGTAPSARWTIGDADSEPRDAIADLAQPYAWSLLRDQHVNGSSGPTAFVLYRTAVGNGATTRFSHLLGDGGNDPSRLDAIPGGGVVLAGRGLTTSDGAWHRAIARVGSDGALAWSKLEASDAGVTDVAWTTAGPVALGSESVSAAGQTVHYLTFQAWDPNGNARWTRKLFPTTSTTPYALAGAGANVVASARMLTSDAAGTGDRLALVRVDAWGEVIGDARYGVDVFTSGTDIASAADGSVLVGYRNVGAYGGAMKRTTPFLNLDCAGDGKCLGKGLADCDDGDACTVDLCAGASGCVHKAAPEGAACDDGDGCTVGDKCSGGVCGGVSGC